MVLLLMAKLIRELKVQIKTTKCRSPCDLYISKNVSKHYAREKCEHINHKSTIQN